MPKNAAAAAWWMAGKRAPQPVKQPALPPWDVSDSSGDVHTTPPAGFDLSKRDPMNVQGDFNGVTLDVNRWGGMPPFLIGANSTPQNMIMAPMLIMYPRKWQDAYLTEYCEHGYSHIDIVCDGWNLNENNFPMTPQALVDWARYLESWGLYRLFWRGMPTLDDPYLHALVDAHAVEWVVPGTETDRWVTSEFFDDVLKNTLNIVSNGLPVGAHFTANYPEGFPRDTFVTNWSDYDGKVHLMWQAEPHDSAGRQGAMLYYARLRVALGQIGGNGQLALKSRVYAKEIMATAQLYGQCNEGYGNLRSLELLYCPVNDPRIPPMAGFDNGSRQHDGTPFLVD